MTCAEETTWILEAGRKLTRLAASQGGELLLTVSEGTRPERRRAGDGRLVRALGDAVTAIAPLGSGRALLGFASGRAEVRAEGEIRLLDDGPGAVTRIAASPDERTFALARSASLALRGDRRLALDLPAGRVVTDLAFTTAGSVVWAKLGSSPWGDDEIVRAWRTQDGGTVSLPANTVGLLSPRVALVEEVRGAAQKRERRLRAVSLGGALRWTSAWWPSFSPLRFEVAPDGRAAVLARLHFVPGERSGLQLSRVDAATGAASPDTVVTPRSPEVYSAVTLRGVSPNRRFALLTGGSGDGCGWSFQGLFVEDLAARATTPLPQALYGGLNRVGGCGRPLARPEARFSSDGRALVVRDGNAVTWLGRGGSPFGETQ